MRRSAPHFLNNAGVLELYVEHGEQAQRSNGGLIACFDRQVVRNAGWTQPMSDPEFPDMECLVAMAREAGTAILEVYETDFEVTRKSDASPLTEADLRSHQTITQRLKERYPEVPILSEESAEHTAYEVRKSWGPFLVGRSAGRNQGVRQAQRASSRSISD